MGPWPATLSQIVQNISNAMPTYQSEMIFMRDGMHWECEDLRARRGNSSSETHVT